MEGLPATAYMWPMGEAWLSLHLYDHFLYTQDGAFLTSTALPVMEESIQFFYEYLYRGEDGSWLSGPSVSPENKYMTADGQTAAITMSPAMDNQILRELCTDYLEGCRLAGVWTKERGMAEEILEHIPTVTIAGDGRIREWYQDYEETEKGHRHISHLFALYPGNQIHRGEPELAEAAKKTLDARLKNGGGHTGWSRVWLICMFARLGDKKAVGDNIRLFLERSVLENLYDSHPPFQIDGNLGICAAAAEMLAQKRGEELELLAAAPEEWTRGSVRGLRLKQGDILDMTWEEEGLSYRIHPTIAHKVRVQYAGQSEELLLEPGKIAEGRFMAPPERRK